MDSGASWCSLNNTAIIRQLIGHSVMDFSLALVVSKLAGSKVRTYRYDGKTENILISSCVGRVVRYCDSG